MTILWTDHHMDFPMRFISIETCNVTNFKLYLFRLKNGLIHNSYLSWTEHGL